MEIKNKKAGIIEALIANRIYCFWTSDWKKHIIVEWPVVILSGSKEYLHTLLAAIREYFKTHLDLEIKDNYQVFLVSSRGIDIVGYRHFHTHVLIRKSIKQNCARALVKRRNIATVASYNSWLNHADTINLKRKLKIAA